MEVTLKNIDTEEKNIDNEEPTEEPTETQQPKEEQEKIIISSVEKKRQNKLYKCEYCNKELSKKSYYYSHNCLLKKQANQQKQEPKQEPIKPIEQPQIYTQPIPEPIIKEVIREVEPTITDEHIKNYIEKQNKIKEDTRRNQHADKMKRLFLTAF